MIDQTAVATGAPVAPKNTSKKDQTDAFAQNHQKGKSFKDLVDGGSPKNIDAQDLVAALADELAENIEPEQKADADTTAPLSRLKIVTNLETLTHYGRNSDGLDDTSKKGALVARDKQKTDKADAKALVPAKESSLVSAADDLRALLGLADQVDSAAPAESIDDEGKIASPKKNTKRDSEGDDLILAKASDEVGTSNVASDMISEKVMITGQEAAAAQNVQSPTTTNANEDDAPAQSSLSVLTPATENLPGDKDAKPVSAELTVAQKKSVSDTEQPATKTEFVTVLESRRYLGFGADTNPGALTHAIKNDSALSNALSIAHLSADKTVTSTEVNTLKLELNPENLGSMTASLRLKGDELSVEVRVETIEAYRQLTNDRDGIVRALQDHGFSIDQVSVQLSPSAKGEGSQDSSQGSNGQNLREGQGESNRQREDNTRRMTNSNTWPENDQSISQNSVGSQSGSNGSANLYL